MYVPNPTASGVDTFTYAANDCPTSPQSWSSTGTVSVNIVPIQTLVVMNVTRYNDNVIDFSKWSINSVDSSIPLNFTITSLPNIGKLLKKWILIFFTYPTIILNENWDMIYYYYFSLF